MELAGPTRRNAFGYEYESGKVCVCSNISVRGGHNRYLSSFINNNTNSTTLDSLAVHLTH